MLLLRLHETTVLKTKHAPCTAAIFVKFDILVRVISRFILAKLPNICAVDKFFPVVKSQKLRNVVRAREFALCDVVRACELTLRDVAPAKHSASHDHENYGHGSMSMDLFGP